MNFLAFSLSFPSTSFSRCMDGGIYCHLPNIYWVQTLVLRADDTNLNESWVSSEATKHRSMIQL